VGQGGVNLARESRREIKVIIREAEPLWGTMEDHHQLADACNRLQTDLETLYRIERGRRYEQCRREENRTVLEIEQGIMTLVRDHPGILLMKGD
jgi:hypothetical protein